MTKKRQPYQKFSMPLGLAEALSRLAARTDKPLPPSVLEPKHPPAPDWKPWGNP